ncbi:hypothetical protein Taro_008460 [Colocasia esculenta]|uniref:Uncharacterized protein n=1 Tax=Colocasia esculenta TaxID=4460 RepID=A0A843TX91_COLES|nr:hypothetical protein [Colocasia esculenta]
MIGESQLDDDEPTWGVNDVTRNLALLMGQKWVSTPLSSLGYWTMAGERHALEHAPTFRELFDQTHKRKGTDDYETYDETMTDHYVEGTPQPDLDLEAWVDAAGAPSVRLWG